MSIQKSSFTFRFLSLLVLIAFLLSTIGITPAQAGGGTLYVKPTATGTGDCLSWANACTLQTALVSAGRGAEIWAKMGTHKPTTLTWDRTATFQLKDGVAVYGGFKGTETTREQRNPANSVTILSGDIDSNDSQTPIIIDITTVTGNGTNSYHVVTGVTGATLDGFTITAGFAGSDYPNNRGGGMYNSYSNPSLINVTFSGNAANEAGGMYNSYSNPSLTNIILNNNAAIYSGGGMMNWQSNPTLSDVTFSDNTASRGGGIRNDASSPVLVNVSFSGNIATKDGGGMANYSSNPTLTNITFSANQAEYGGGIYNDSSNPILTNVTFSANTVTNSGGGMVNIQGSPTLTNTTFMGNSAASVGGGISNFINSNPQIRNTILWGNTAVNIGAQIYNDSSIPVISDSIMQDGCPDGSSCTNIITDSPQLGVLGNYGGFTQTIPLLAGSSAIDSGSDAFCPATDQRGVARPVGFSCDIGSFEEAEPHPYIISITRADSNAVNAASVGFNITFSEPVDNVHDYDFQVTTTGTISGAEVTNITGDTTHGVVTVSTGTGTGTIRLDIPSGVGIVDTDDNLLSGLPYTSGETYSVRPQTFADVPMNYWSWNFIERLYLTGITGGCGSGNFCPTQAVTRAQMAVFLLVAEHGSSYTPPAASGIFNDVPASNGFAPWIEQLSTEGITGGCGGGNYCPNAPVTRAQMAVFLLVAEHGTGYIPPVATGVFTDVPADNPFAPWIEQLAAEGITGGCGSGNFCPNTVVNRGQMAVFLVTAFNLP